jgi:hypothetical protein
LPSLKCSKEDCIADFALRKDARLKNPGACPLEFQSVMQILTECLLRWDIKTRTSKGKGILGTVLHLLVLTKNKVAKHYINIGRLGLKR